MKKNLALLVLFTAVGSVGCASIPLQAGAEQVQFLGSRPKGCQYLGEATGHQGNAFTGGWTSNANMETGARNDLKNKAYKMGGNAVVVLTERAAETKQSGGSGSQTNVIITGTIFKCPQEVLDNL